jgi:hypothetical protein
MNTIYAQQEILLSISSRFSKTELSEHTVSPNKSLSRVEMLENACWFGFLEALMPELFIKSGSGNSLFKMYIHTSRRLVKIGLNEVFQVDTMPPYREQVQSIDPNVFFGYIDYN